MVYVRQHGRGDGAAGDDRLGRALHRLFIADRAALLTEVGQAFALNFDEFHNDSTTVSFCGAYRSAWDRKIRGRTAPAITYGHSKAHHPVHSHSERRRQYSRRVSLQRRAIPATPAPTSTPGTPCA